jgi:peptide/nickel transport system ATP-binding protein
MSMSTPPEHIVEVRELRIGYQGNAGLRTIVASVDLEVCAGEAVAIVGESGSGKSMTARALAGLLPRDVVAGGQARFVGRDLMGLPERRMRRLRGSQLALVPQDPFTMLNPLIRCGAQITEGLPRRGKAANGSAREEAVRRLAEVGIDDPTVADRYPFQLSGGMRQRVGIAAALAGDPRLLIADEPSTALDVTTQKEILALLKRLQDRRGMALILITHDLRVAFSMCQRIYVMYAGAVLECGRTADLEREPLHPYTLGLLLAEPSLHRRLVRLTAIPGSVLAADDVQDRCRFASRCAWAAAECNAGEPPLRAVDTTRSSACRRLDAIRGEMASQHRTAVGGHAIHSAGSPVTQDAPLIAVSAVSKDFVTGRGRHTQRVTALRDVSLHVRPGESVGLVGESGSGKTTLGRCLVGLETVTHGSIEIDGVSLGDPRRLARSERARVRRTVQMVFQDPYSSLNPAIPLQRALAEALNAAGAPSARRDVEQLLERVGLPTAYLSRKPAPLSGGERERVAIARALAAQARVLVCDEPVSALDVSVQAQILNLLRTLQADLGLATLFITHDLAVVRQVVDRVYVLYRGEIVEEGPVDRVLDAPVHPYTIKLIDSVLTTEAQASA